MLGGPLKPKSPDNSDIEEGKKIYGQMVALFEPVAAKYPVTKEYKRPEPFGNNFILLFRSIKDEEEKKAGKGIKSLYFKKAEDTYGETWKRFLEENDGLVKSIQELIEELKPQEEIHTLRMQLAKKGLWDLVDRSVEEIGDQRIFADVWNRLSPLLEEASNKMRQYGMDPEEFYGGK